MIRKVLKLNADKFRAGNISYCLDIWKSITSDREILGSVAGLRIPFLDTPKQHPGYKISFNVIEMTAISAEIQNWRRNK